MICSMCGPLRRVTIQFAYLSRQVKQTNQQPTNKTHKKHHRYVLKRIL